MSTLLCMLACLAFTLHSFAGHYENKAKGSVAFQKEKDINIQDVAKSTYFGAQTPASHVKQVFAAAVKYGQSLSPIPRWNVGVRLRKEYFTWLPRPSSR